MKINIKKLAEDLGWKKAEICVGNRILVKYGFNNDPMEFLNLFNDLDVVQSEEDPDWTLFRYKQKENLMVYDRKNEYVYINYNKIWTVLRNNFDLNYDETQELTKRWLDEVYNLRGVTTCEWYFKFKRLLDEVYNLRGVTTDFLEAHS